MQAKPPFSTMQWLCNTESLITPISNISNHTNGLHNTTTVLWPFIQDKPGEQNQNSRIHYIRTPTYFFHFNK